MLIQPVILSGGAGTRLWPISRQQNPKPFCRIGDNASLFAQSLNRVQDGQARGIFSAPLIVGAQAHAEKLRAVLRDCEIEARILLEPVGRDTAACVAMAALMAEGENFLQLVMPVDHYIGNKDSFYAAVQKASTAAQDGHLVCFGIEPDGVETGYGHIQAGAETDIKGVYHIDAFKEKPDAAQARDWFETGAVLWNSGMFLFRPDMVLGEMAVHCPEILTACKRAFENRISGAAGDTRFGAEDYAAIPAQPIDIAVLEKTAKACVIPTNMGWADIGTWQGLYALSEKDENANVLNGDVVALNAKGNFVHIDDTMADKKLVVLSGVDNLIVVQTQDALMIVPRHDAQAVKHIVTDLQNQNRRCL